MVLELSLEHVLTFKFNGLSLDRNIETNFFFFLGGLAQYFCCRKQWRADNFPIK